MIGTRHETPHETHPAIGTHRDHVPSHGEIGSLIVVTAAANLRLAHWRVPDRRLVDHADDAVGRRSH